MDKKKFKRDFCSQLNNPSGLEALFDFIPEIYFWVKNKKGQFVMLNHADAEKCGGTREADIIGKTDFDVFPKDLAENYAKDDMEVIRTGNKITNRVEFVPNEDGTIDWYSTNKVPLYSKTGEIIGVAGTTKNFKKASSLLKPYMDMSDIVSHISEHYVNRIEVKTLASMMDLSISQFERKFKKAFNQSPMKFIIHVRIKAACKALIQTRETISIIAQKTGFYDQSTFTRQFRKYMGMLPREYRKKLSLKPAH
jgi:PAS domain S-box-containing protein